MTRCYVAIAFAALLAAVSAPVAAAALPAQFGSYGEGAGQLDEGRGAAVEQNSGDVYIADRNNSRVEEWSKEGVFLQAWGWGVDKEKPEEKLQTCTTATGCRPGSGGAGAGQFSSPRGIAVDNSSLGPGLSHGDVYVVDAENNRVQKFGPNGEFILMFGGEVNATPGAINPDVCLAGEACQAGVPGSADGEFEGLSSHQLASIAVNAEGDVYVGDADGVQRFSEDGVYEATVLAGAEIDALAAAPGGDIYALSSAGAGVREYESSGKEVVVVPARDEAGAPETIATGPGGSLFVDDDPNSSVAETHSIRVYNAAGEETQVFDEGEEDGAYGIGWSEAAGVLYVVGEEGGRRVRMLTPPPPGPVVRPGSELASEVDPTTAVLGATVNPEDQEGEGEYDFEYGTAPCTPASCGSATPEPAGKLAKSFEGDEVKAPLSKLQPNTTYHFRVVASDSKGHRTVGPEASFTTPPAVRIEETSVYDVAATSATFAAELNPLSAQASWRIEYAGEAAKLGTAEAAIAGEGTLAVGSAPVAVSAHVQTGLSPATTYHYRVVAKDEREGVAYTVDGPDETFITQGEGAAQALPDGRVWELVSPPERHGAAIQPANGTAPIQAAAGGGAIAYGTLGAIEAAVEGSRAPEASTVLSTHGSAGWSSRDIAAANETVSEEGFKLGDGSEYRLFSSDLSTALIELPVGATPLPPTAEDTPYLHYADGSFEALVTAANVEAGVRFGGAVSFSGATPDLTHVALGSRVSLLHNAGPGLYEWSGGHLQFVGSGGLAGSRGAISNSGARVFWSNEGHLYMFDAETESSVQLDTVQPNAGHGSPSASFQDASVEGTRAFFTDSQELMPGTSEGSLYAYDVGSGSHPPTLSDLTIPVNAGENAGVQGLLPGVSEDGSYVYAVASGVLTTRANEYGETATAGADNLYELHLDGASWQPAFIATLSGGDAPDWGSSDSTLVDLTARVSPDGRYLAFMSQRSLTGYDNTDVNEATGRHADEEVYLYDAQSERLVCASCNPSGARPTGIDDQEPQPLVDEERVWLGTWLAANVPGWTPMRTGEALYQSRYLDDAGRLFFDSADALVPQAVNHTEDVYEYEPPGEDSCSEASATYSAASGGCVSLISSGTSGEESAFLDASESGDDVFFYSAARLTPQAPASGYNVFDAHVCGAGWACAAPQPVASPPCATAESCRAAPATQPSTYGAPSSATFSGQGNLTPVTGAGGPKKVTKKTVKCKRGFAKNKKGKCIRKKSKKKAKKSSKKKGK